MDSDDAYAFQADTVLLKLEIIALTNQIKSLTIENTTLKHSIAYVTFDPIPEEKYVDDTSNKIKKMIET